MLPHARRMDVMTEEVSPRINKIPFLVGDVLLSGMAFLICFVLAPAGSLPMLALAVVSLALGAALGVAPFILEYRTCARISEAGALAGVVSKLQQVEKVASQIESASAHWQTAQEASGKTVDAARQIAERMTAEVQAFGDFMQRVNDNEKTNLRVEVEKLRRAESDWLQVLIRTLDHVYALHVGATRSGQPALMDQINNFQNACRDAARRVGLTPFMANPGDPLDPARHQVLDGREKPAPDAVIGDTVATGYSFQGRLVRPALVRLKAASAQTEAPLETGAGTSLEK
jgi:molecular chaperone GrpE (heat shock protein)